MKAISIRKLQFQYPKRKGYAPFALDIDSWDLEKGEKVVLFGPSGCGKSTLLNLICGMNAVESGSLVVCGKEMSKLNERQRRAHRIRNMGFVFQDFPLVEYLNAMENVLLPYRINPALRLDQLAKKRAGQLLSDFGLHSKRNQRPVHLSQGERQRVAIARSLVTQPQVLLADEPTAGLDPERSMQVLDKLDELVTERALSLVLVTHDPQVKARFQNQMNVGLFSNNERLQ